MPIELPIAKGGNLAAPTLIQAYRHGIFPWYSAGQDILWWSPDPRMTLQPRHFRLCRSLRKALQQMLRQQRVEVRINHDFAAVIAACAHTPRQGQDGTWILPEMQQAYIALHQQGFAHSVETWLDGQLQGGLYCVAIGKAVFGESMFSWHNNASKIALAALVALCLRENIELIDCQQATPHLASLGGRVMPKRIFLDYIVTMRDQPAARWQFQSNIAHPQQDWQPVLSLRKA